MLERQGWRLYAHPHFLAQLERLVTAVERAKRADPEGWRTKTDARLLAALNSLVLDRIPRDPLAAAFRQGTLSARITATGFAPSSAATGSACSFAPTPERA